MSVGGISIVVLLLLASGLLGEVAYLLKPKRSNAGGENTDAQADQNDTIGLIDEETDNDDLSSQESDGIISVENDDIASDISPESEEEEQNHLVANGESVSDSDITCNRARDIAHMPKANQFANIGQTVEYVGDSLEKKLSLASESVQSRYGKLERELLTLRGVRAHMGVETENFYTDSYIIAKLELKGDEVCLHLALDESDIPSEEYVVEKDKERKRYIVNPSVFARYRVANDKQMVYAYKLIKLLADKYKLTE